MNSSPPNRSSVSAFIVCQNETRQIERCLKSVSWCDEIVVVDSGSTDDTLEIAKRYTSHIYHRKWTGYVDQKAYGLEKCQCDWALNLDADEEVSEKLKLSILEALENDKKDLSNLPNGFYLSRVVYFLGRYWNKGGWYPEYRLRLCRRLVTKWGGIDPHEKAEVPGPTAKLTGELYHYTYSDFTDQVRRINTLAGNAAKTMYANGRKTRISDFIFRPATRFIKFYIIKKGFLEGLPGFIVAHLEALQVLLKYAKLWEMHHRLGPNERSQKTSIKS